MAKYYYVIIREMVGKTKSQRDTFLKKKMKYLVDIYIIIYIHELDCSKIYLRNTRDGLVANFCKSRFKQMKMIVLFILNSSENSNLEGEVH